MRNSITRDPIEQEINENKLNEYVKKVQKQATEQLNCLVSMV